MNEIVPRGQAVARARAIAAGWLNKPDLTRRFTRVHFTLPIMQRLLSEVGYGLTLEGASAAALVKQNSTPAK